MTRNATLSLNLEPENIVIFHGVKTFWNGISCLGSSHEIVGFEGARFTVE